MANYEHLPIFKKMMDLAVFMEQTVRHCSRYHKYTLGSELRTMCHEALALIVQANSLPGASVRKAHPTVPDAGVVGCAARTDTPWAGSNSVPVGTAHPTVPGYGHDGARSCESGGE